ncbi:MAG: hypothetical protein IH586_23425 [Anaerolineaceae bacterium]|nr:hypothetical protein [Anaerolineaceae bacterium]
MKDGGKNIQYPRLKPGYNNDVNNLITTAPIFLDPLLSALANNGGPTPTMALSPGSPAINQANPARCPGLDQRGYTRQGSCDIGPFELGGVPFVPSNWIFLPFTRQ